MRSEKGTKLEESYLKYRKSKKLPWYQANPLFPRRYSPKNGKLLIYERHRHRYEFNNRYRKRYEQKGFVVSGTSPEGKLVEAIEIRNHPFFVGTQFHTEYLSRPLTTPPNLS